MTRVHHFQLTLENLKQEVERHGDVLRGARSCAFDVLRGILMHPFDCGIRRFRTISIGGPKVSGNGVVHNERDYLLTVRGIDESGQDVVCFTGGPSLEMCCAEFCNRAAHGIIAWKPDERRSPPSPAGSFLDQVLAAHTPSGPPSNGAGTESTETSQRGSGESDS